MKIVMFGHKRIPSREGGVEIVVEQLACRMAALGHQVCCYNRGSRKNKSTGACPGVQIETVLTVDKKGLAAVSSSFFAAVKSAFSRADVVHIHAEGPAFMCWLPRLLGKRVIVTVHGLDWDREKWRHGFASKYIRMGEKMAVRWAHEIVVLSENVQEYFLRTYGRKTVFIPNGVSSPALCPAREITEKFGLHKGEYILFLGRLVPEKGIHSLLEAYAGLQTDKKLVIAGGASDSEDYAAELHKMAAGDERVIFTGFVQGKLLQELYTNAFCYVLPSALEGMPLSLLEAMSYGLACVVSDIPECSTVVEEHGVVFRRGDTQHLRERLQGLLDRPQEAERLGQQAAEHVLGRYGWDDVVHRTMELYKKDTKK